MDSLGFRVLPKLIDEAHKLDAEIRLLKDSRKGRAIRKEKGRKAEPLRITEPW